MRHRRMNRSKNQRSFTVHTSLSGRGSAAAGKREEGQIHHESTDEPVRERKVFRTPI